MPQATNYDAIVIGRYTTNSGLCAEGGEIMTTIQVAMMSKLSYAVLKKGIFTHPTLAEGLNHLFMTLDS